MDEKHDLDLITKETKRPTSTWFNKKETLNLRIERIKIVRRFSIKMRRPIVVSHREMTSRKIAWVSVQVQLLDQSITRNGERKEIGKGLGEIAPLSGYHLDSFDQACQRVEKIGKKLEGLIYEVEDLNIRSGVIGRLFESTVGGDIKSSVQFGIECALIQATLSFSKLNLLQGLQVLFGHHDATLSESTTTRSFVHLNATFPRTSTSSPSRTLSDFFKKSHLKSFNTFKIKVGASTPQQDATFIQQVFNTLYPNPNPSNTTPNKFLRLDANQAWSPSEFHQFLTLLPPLIKNHIQYIEEPLQNPLHLLHLPSTFSTTQSIPIALDETLIQPSSSTQNQNPFKELLFPLHYQHLVLHPLFLPTFCKVSEFGERIDWRITVACAYESPLGLCWNTLIAKVADLMRGEDGAHGLGAHLLMEYEGGFVEECIVGDSRIDVGRCVEYLERLVGEVDAE